MIKQVLIITALLFIADASPAEAIIDSINGCQNAETSTFSSPDVNITISSSGTPTISSTIVVQTPNTYITDIDLKTFISHNFSSDLDITLTSPKGTSIIITSDNGALVGGNFDGTEWDDFATSISLKTFTNNVLVSTAAPEQGFSAFQGENPNGTWTLTIMDDESGDGGVLKKWSLTFGTCSNTLGRSTSNVFTATAASQPIPDDNPTGVSSVINVSGAAGDICGIIVRTFITHYYIGDLTVALKAPGGFEVILSNRVGRDTFTFIGTIWGTKNAAPVTDYLVDRLPGTTPSDATFLSPQRPFGALFNSAPNGAWTLTVSDQEAQDIGTFDSWSIDVETCGVDSDLDGVSDDFDGCPADPQKLVPGICGCGIADADSNNNGILDCNVNEEFKLLVNAAKNALARVKKAETDAARKKQRGKIKVVSKALIALKAFLAKPGVNVIGASGASITKLHTTVQKSVKKALKSLTKEDLKNAAKAFKNLLAQI